MARQSLPSAHHPQPYTHLVKHHPATLLCLIGLLACIALSGCAHKQRPRDARKDSSQLTSEPMDPTDLNGRLLHTVGLP